MLRIYVKDNKNVSLLGTIHGFHFKLTEYSQRW